MSKRATAASALLLSLLGAACSGSDPEQSTGTQENTVSAAVNECISSNPASEPFDVGDVTTASPPPMSGAPAPAAPTVETIAGECRSRGGSRCDASFLSREAARCIARDADLAAGLEEWAIALTYNNSYRRVVWTVQNVLVDNGAAGYSGESLTLDAVDGRVLGRTSWNAQH